MEIREEILEQIAALIDAIERQGFSINRTEYYPEGFGDLRIDFRKGHEVISVGRERSMWWAHDPANPVDPLLPSPDGGPFYDPAAFSAAAIAWLEQRRG